MTKRKRHINVKSNNSLMENETLNGDEFTSGMRMAYLKIRQQLKQAPIA